MNTARTFRNLVGAIIAAFAATVLVWQASSAVFTATTDNTGNSFTAADINLTDDDAGTAMFTVDPMVPGQTETECIVVTYDGTAAIPTLNSVRLYGAVTDSANNMADHLNITVEEGTGAAGFGDCTGFTPNSTIETDTLNGFNANHTDYATGAVAWTPAGSPEDRSFRFTVEMDAAAPDTIQGEAVTVDFTWEIQTLP